DSLQVLRRNGTYHEDGDPLEGTAPEDAGAESRPDHRRLPPADDVRDDGGEPRPGGVADLAEPEGAGTGSRHADPRDVTALPRGRAAPRQAADPLRSEGVGKYRAGRRSRHVRLPRRVLQR